MTYRIAWLSPLTPASGVGTFSHAILRDFPTSFKGERIDVTILYVGHERLYRSRHRAVRIGHSEDFREILTLFDLIIYNIGNNREHHEPIFDLLRVYPGLVVCHDFVYQHYLADVSLTRSRSFSPFAALLLKHGDASAPNYLRRSRITSRTGQIRYSPWDTELSVSQPMSEPILALGSSLVVHSRFAQRHAVNAFNGPVLRLGMPHDQKPKSETLEDVEAWARSIETKAVFRLVSFGHIQRTKCIDLVLSALASSAILRRRVRYTIAGFVGDRGYYDHLKAIVVSSQLDNTVSFEIDVPDRRLQELMRDSDVFLNLRRPNTEGSSVSLIEQLDTGKPVVVLDSGCYAEIPSDGAVKAPTDATGDDIRLALEKLIAAPRSMPIIGAAGRAYAREWTCASYGHELLRFAFTHRDLLEKRATAIAVGATARADLYEKDTWTRELARARTSLRYLHANVLLSDPVVLLGKSAADLCEHTASIVFGIFNNARLDGALSRFFAGLATGAAYWACVRFAVIADAVFSDDTEARERLKGLKPCYEPEFWAVVENFPPRQHLATAMLILAQRYPTPEEFTTVGLDDEDGFPKRLRTRDIIRRFTTRKDVALDRLERWLGENCTPSLEIALPAIETDFECDVGDPTFRSRVDLSGFHSMEPDHAWTRGTHGFVGLRLKEQAARVEVLVNSVDASPEQPCTLSILQGDCREDTEVSDCEPRWLSLRLQSPGDLAWLKFSTTRAACPNNGDDRLLGLCFRRLRVTIEPQKPADSFSSVRRFTGSGGERPARQSPVRSVPDREDVALAPELVSAGA